MIDFRMAKFTLGFAGISSLRFCRGRLVQPILDLVETGNGAGLVFVAARSASGGDATDRVVPDLDGCAALSCAEGNAPRLGFKVL
jgi:hypothetical protein